MPLPTLPNIRKGTPPDVVLKMVFTGQSSLRIIWQKAKADLGKNLDLKVFKADLGPTLDAYMKKMDAGHAEYRKSTQGGTRQPSPISAPTAAGVEKATADVIKIVKSYRGIAATQSKDTKLTDKQRAAWGELHTWLEKFEFTIAAVTTAIMDSWGVRNRGV